MNTKRMLMIAALAGLLTLGALAEWALSGQSNTAEITVVLTDYGVHLSQETVRPGQRVKLLIFNQGRERHELEVEEYGVEVEDILPGEQRVLTFRAGSAGLIRLSCHLAGHFEQGMYTALQVGR